LTDRHFCCMIASAGRLHSASGPVLWCSRKHYSAQWPFQALAQPQDDSSQQAEVESRIELANARTSLTLYFERLVVVYPRHVQFRWDQEWRLRRTAVTCGSLDAEDQRSSANECDQNLAFLLIVFLLSCPSASLLRLHSEQHTRFLSQTKAANDMVRVPLRALHWDLAPFLLHSSFFRKSWLCEQSRYEIKHHIRCW
jgi:hypothetical protein